MPVKFFHAVRQQPHVSTVQLQQAWREQVGPLVASLQQALGLSRYVQLHRTPGTLDETLRSFKGKLLDTSVPPYDIVDEYTFEGTLTQFLAAFSNHQALWLPLLELQRPLVDAQGSSIGLVTEVPQVLNSKSANSLIASPYNHLARIFVTAEMDEAYGGFEHWGDEHASLVRRWAAASAVYTYVQNHPRRGDTADRVLSMMREEWAVGDLPGKDGWYATAIIEDSILSGAGPVSLQSGQEIATDEASGWMKEGSVNYMVGKEYIFVDRYRV